MISGYIATNETINKFVSNFKNVKIVQLDENMSFVSVTKELPASWQLMERLRDSIAYIELINSRQLASVWCGGEMLYNKVGVGTINQALKLLGIKARENADEFETVGLCKYKLV